MGGNEASCSYVWSSKAVDNWILKLKFFQNDKFIASSSDGSILGYSLNNLAQTPLINFDKAHESSVNDMTVINENLIASCSTDGIKIWDVRSNKSTPQILLGNSKNSNFLSLASKNDLLAGGTELQGVDAEVHIWDIRNTEKIVKSFVDSHHDDVTCLEFHPTLNYLMSGSTDGYVNIYDLSKVDEEDALHQVINFGSVHSCHFITESRISILTHIETLMFHDLNDTNYENLESPKFEDLGDLRIKWPLNDYVIDLNPSGFVAYGSNTNNSVSILPFNPVKEKFKESRIIHLQNAHNDEVVRDVIVKTNTTQCLSCGEDGKIKLWELPHVLKSYSFGEQIDEPVLVTSPTSEKKKTSKHKKEHKKIKDQRFKPY
ncbi:uncharacterized protein KGF55_000217 [Candida pseudojiufengensis]|uniref:uncharacterized protein n=1 Tax=Candida pseudojiufengensis TaxID=497109 RepID=UPI0022249E7B|nr:uncharacterized protein KGF55_000217 [Candida pseudojiufengensis]KAI5966808.1 hypothetical protein KGF55_000217 [Candida pseudojiufengensis]